MGGDWWYFDITSAHTSGTRGLARYLKIKWEKKQPLNDYKSNLL